MVDVKWSSPTDLTVSGGATYTQADLDAHIGAALAEAAAVVPLHHVHCDHMVRSVADIQQAILAISPTALTALERAKEEAEQRGYARAMDAERKLFDAALDRATRLYFLQP